MISIRTITYNISNNFNKFDVLNKCIKKWKENKYFIRTVRISTEEINQIPNDDFYMKVDTFCDNNDIRWFCVPIKLDNANLIDYASHMIKKYDKAFININGVQDGEIDFNAIDSYIKLLKETGKNDYEDNFRLGLSVNVKEDTPFFPFASSSGNLNFSIGLELTGEINKIVDKNLDKNLNELREIIISSLDNQITEIENYALKIQNEYDIKFQGFDFSLAPIMEDNGSIGELIDKLGVKEFNGSGIMFVTSYLTNILKSFGNRHKTVGFSGVMYSLLEDEKLCEINNSIGIKLEDLIKLSTMCGCGIDMVPIYNDYNADIIKAYILDICAISCRLNKPLGVRFISLPRKSNITNFKNNKDFITNTKILDLSHNKVIDNNIKEFSFIKLNS